MPDADEEFRALLMKRLDTIIVLLLERNLSEQITVSETAKIERLTELGLSSIEIADVLGKTSNYVNTVKKRFEEKSKVKRKKT